jgi:hypothetical protein
MGSGVRHCHRQGVSQERRVQCDRGNAELLREMLADQSVPTPLRLVLSQTTETDSLQDWSSRIAYYERPNRAELIRGVYQRAVNVASRIPAEIAQESAEIPQLSSSAPATQFETRKEKPPTRTRKHAAAVAVAVVVALLATAGVWFVRTSHVDVRPAIAEWRNSEYEDARGFAASIVNTGEPHPDYRRATTRRIDEPPNCQRASGLPPGRESSGSCGVTVPAWRCRRRLPCHFS